MKYYAETAAILHLQGRIRIYHLAFRSLEATRVRLCILDKSRLYKTHAHIDMGHDSEILHEAIENRAGRDARHQQVYLGIRGAKDLV